MGIQENKANNNVEPKPVNEFTTVRAWLAIGVTALSIFLAGTLALIVIISAREPNGVVTGPAKDAMNALLPLLGTWVGTVLAFYFAKENFEAAQKSVADFAKQITGQEKLQSISATDKMIPLNQIAFKVLPKDQNTKIADILTEMEQGKKGRRLPILSDKNFPLYVIHLSRMDRYLVEVGAQDPSALQSKTLRNLLDEKKDDLNNTFVTIKESDTLASAKTAMEAVGDCEDVFVTKSGTKDDAVLGWITNVIIRQNSTV